LVTGQRLVGNNKVKSRSVGAILVKVREGESIARTEEDISVLLRERHRLESFQDDDFMIRNLAEVSEARDAGARTLELLLAIVASISLAVGGVGVMNIMLVSVTERTREIGLRRAMGARRRDVMQQFLLESIGLTVSGGVIGVNVGLAAAYIASQLVGWHISIEPQAIIIAVLCSAIVGLLSGWYPAMRASRLDPIEALRSFG
jgi:putative ABC transport system permease protein